MNTVALVEKIESCGFSKSLIAETLGITRQGFYNKLNGIREFKGSEIKKLSTVLNLSEHEQQEIFFC